MHGVGRYFANVMPRFNPEVVRPTLCILGPWHRAARDLDAVGVRPIFLNRRKWDPRISRSLSRIAIQADADVLHLAGMKGCYLGRRCARRLRLGSIIHLHDTIELRTPLGFLQRTMAPWTDLAIAVSRPVARLAEESFGLPADKIRVIHNGVDVDAIAADALEGRRCIREELKIDARRPVVGIVGRISAEKGHLPLLEAWPKLLKRCPEALLVIVGDGPRKQDCESLVQQTGLSESVRFLGYRTDVAKVLGAMDVLAMPSIREGLGFAAIEATAAGVPVVAFEVGGLAEVVSHQISGVLTPAGDYDGFVTAVSDTLLDQRKRSRMQQGCAGQAAKFCIADHVRQLEIVYKSIVDGRRA